MSYGREPDEAVAAGRSRFAIGLALALVACGVGPRRIDVSGMAGDVHFTVTAPEDTDRACADELSIAPVAPENADLMWQVFAVAPARCFDRVRYGKLTADITQGAPAIPLRPNVAYRVRASGAGFSVTRDFRLTPQGVKLLD